MMLPFAHPVAAETLTQNVAKLMTNPLHLSGTIRLLKPVAQTVALSPQLANVKFSSNLKKMVFWTQFVLFTCNLL